MYSDYLPQHGKKSLIIIDRHLAWSPLQEVGKKEGAQGLISALKTNHTTLGVNVEIPQTALPPAGPQTLPPAWQ